MKTAGLLRLASLASVLLPIVTSAAVLSNSASPVVPIVAPPLPQPAPAVRRTATATNGVFSKAGNRAPSTLKREIQLTDYGAEATWGRSKVSFPSSLGSRISVIAPDARNLAFRPTYLVLENRVTHETLRLGTITNNSTGTVNLPNTVVWSNIFDAGPRVSLEIIYNPGSAKGIEQNIIIEEALPELPDGWSAQDVVLECWTEFWMDTAPGVETRTLALRQQTATNAVVLAQDDIISFGAARITGRGGAFSIGGPASRKPKSIPVAKSWVQASSENGKDPARRFLIESIDLPTALPQMRSLPKPARHASISKPKSGRSELLQAKVTEDDSADRIKAIRRPKANPKPMLIATSEPIPSRGFLVDFTLLEAVPIPANAVSWWPAGGNAVDALTNHNDGSEAGSLTYVAGEVGQGFGTDGDSTYVQVPDAPSLNPTNGMTLEAWIYMSEFDGNHTIIRKDGECGNRQFLLSVAPSQKFRAHIGITNGTYYYIDSTNTVQVQTWYHVAMSYSASASNLSLYVNGALNNQGLVTGSTIRTAEPLGIGGMYTDCWEYDFNGVIDEPAMYSRALSASEIQSIYNAGPAGKINPNCVSPSTNAVGWWPGDGNAFDIAHTNAGILHNGAGFISAVVGQGFSFDGGSQFVEVPNNSDLNPTNQLTIEAWVYLDYDNGNQAIIRKDGECSDRQFMLTAYWGDYDHLGFRAHVGIQGGGYNYVDSESEIYPETWYHVAEVYNGTNLNLYINGQLDASTSLTGHILTTTQPLCIGGSDNGCWDYNWPGKIDEVSLYNRALTGTEISAIYSAGCAGKCKVDSDSDGLTDLQEAWIGTNPNNSDTDGDGVPDGVEFFQGRNPKVAGSIADTNNVIKLEVYTPLK